ncbi:MAG: lysylphosphatidylglycerol synthase transmembrane domain-containing protein [Bacilli bacterium]
MALSARTKRRLTWIWGAAVALLVGVFTWRERQDVIRALPYLAHADYAVLIVTTACEFVFFVLQGYAAQLLYKMYNKSTGVAVLTAMLVQATMLNEVLPTSGAAGAAGFVYWGDRLKYGLGDSIAVSIWMSALSYVALIPLVGICIRAVFVLPAAPRTIILDALKVMVLFAAAGAIVLYGLYRYGKTAADGDPPTEGDRGTSAAQPRNGRQDVPQRLFRRLQMLKGWYGRGAIGREWRRGAAQPGRLAFATLMLTAIYAVRVLMLELCFMALHVSLGLRPATYAYALTLLFSVVSLAPTTLGVVEVALTTTLGWFGVPVPLALAGTLLYRIASFWLPIPAGLLCQAFLGNRLRTNLKST